MINNFIRMRTRKTSDFICIDDISVVHIDEGGKHVCIYTKGVEEPFEFTLKHAADIARLETLLYGEHDGSFLILEVV